MAAEINLYQIRAVQPKPVATKEVLKFTPGVRRVIFRALASSCIGFLALYLTMSMRIAQERKQLESILSLRPKIELAIDFSSSYSELEEVKKELENKLSTLNLIMEKRILLTNKFNELPKVIMPGVWLRSLSFTDQLSENNIVTRSLDIQGFAYHEDSAQEIGMVTKFISNLKTNAVFFQGFQEIKLVSMSSETLQERAVKNFTISCAF